MFSFFDQFFFSHKKTLADTDLINGKLLKESLTLFFKLNSYFSFFINLIFNSLAPRFSHQRLFFAKNKINICPLKYIDDRSLYLYFFKITRLPYWTDSCSVTHWGKNVFCKINAMKLINFLIFLFLQMFV